MMVKQKFGTIIIAFLVMPTQGFCKEKNGERTKGRNYTCDPV